MTIYLLSLLIALAGSTLHWAKRYTRNQTHNNLLNYMMAFKSHTVASLGAILASVGVVASSGILDLHDPAMVSNLILGGYAIDSAINKDQSVKPMKPVDPDEDSVYAPLKNKDVDDA